MVTINKQNNSPEEHQKEEEEEVVVILRQIHRRVLTGTPLTRESYECAALLSSQLAVGGPPATGTSFQSIKCNTGGSSQSGVTTAATMTSKAEHKSDHRITETQQKVCPREIVLLQLSLIKTIIIKALCPETNECIRQKYTEIIGILLKQTHIDSKIISLLGCPDKLMAHIASRCMAYLVLFQLKEESKVNEVWLCACLEMFSDPAKDPSAEHLGSFLGVLKIIFRDRSLHVAESLPKLLGPLDAALESLYEFLLPPSSSHSCQSGSLDSGVINNLSAFVDLMEVLVALRGRLQQCFRCQRSLFLRASHVLQSITSAVPYFTKKKLVLLLKKCLLSKAGEDLLPAPLPPWPVQDLYLEGDILALAQAVLQAVNSGWLQKVSVERKTSYFGGTSTISEKDAPASPDIGILRALSLTLLKALEIQLQHSASEAGVKADVQNFMSQLLTFLQSHLQRARLKHACEWIALIFIEQDDDMLEAVKTLLALYLESERFCRKPLPVTHLGEDDASGTAATHEIGYNPHCLFLFFLNSITFDATVLLDFLISSETCFLEYFVRYLKLLKGDWPHFCHVCKLFDTSLTQETLSVCEASASKPESSSSGADSRSDAFPETHEDSPLSLTPHPNPHVTQSVKPSQPHTSSLGALQSLVDYESSEESEMESLEQGCETNINQNYARHSGSFKIRKALSRHGGKDVETTVLRPSDDHVLSLQQKCCDEEISSAAPLRRSVQCLEELRNAVSRLHRRNLFPYNPSALLKLLVHIDVLTRRQRVL